MQQVAAVRSVTQAVRMLKQIQVQAPEGGDYREAGRAALGRLRYRVLLLDGVVLSRKSGMGALRRPVLVALGITCERRLEIIDFALAPAESQPAWEAFLQDLHARGLTGPARGARRRRRTPARRRRDRPAPSAVGTSEGSRSEPTGRWSPRRFFGHRRPRRAGTSTRPPNR